MYPTCTHKKVSRTAETILHVFIPASYYMMILESVSYLKVH